MHKLSPRSVTRRELDTQLSPSHGAMPCPSLRQTCWAKHTGQGRSFTLQGGTGTEALFCGHTSAALMSLTCSAGDPMWLPQARVAEVVGHSVGPVTQVQTHNTTQGAHEMVCLKEGGRERQTRMRYNGLGI